MEQLEIENWAGEIRRIAALKDDDLVVGPDLAVRIVGEENVSLCSGSLGARLVGRRIIVPREHPDPSFAFAHEVAELVLAERGAVFCSHEEKERAANYIAAATLSPAATVRRAYRYFGEDLTKIARVFGVSKTSAALRIGEVTGNERAVVTSEHDNILVRNANVVDWCPAKVLPVAAGKIPPESLHPGLMRATLRGGIDSKRVVLWTRIA